ncbi:ATP-binding protein [Aureliella helgolandensis]|uniref:histidine kinase n=1 Tax=Aureliella helgolandensis TaxID=2527968 RepID=A0A518G7C1_9BACT|nr:ATP-binding protein [Aureliella helgolandensis]QDV24479.1 Signal transduction histidine-protein kinase BarA [Aureliella helgolandensis]
MRATFQSILNFLRAIIRVIVVGWSLESKSLLFLAFALVIPIGSSFWFVLEVVADGLVMQTTQQAARDYADSMVAWSHVDRDIPSIANPVFPSEYFMPDVLKELREDLIENPNYHHEFLMLEETSQHIELDQAEHPQDAQERRVLEDLQIEFRQYLAEQSSASEAAAGGGASNTNPSPLSPSVATSTGAATEPPDILLTDPLATTNDPLNAAEEPTRRFFFREAGPLYPAENERKDFFGPTPSEGWYVYYHAVKFTESCMRCHKRYPTSTAEAIPFRVVKVLLPHRQTQVASATTLAVMIAIAMVTVAATLVIVHWVLKRLVLMPLKHLRSVSDEISRGNTNLRANIDTGDEFNELADAFNRMIRHMTESQGKLQNLNQELDVRVDQLAQANLNLFEANRLKSDFLANMSHELRTPLNSIIGFSDVLHDIPSLSEKQKRYASNIQRSGKLLLDMINDILDLAKVEAGKMTVTPTSFNLVSLTHAQCDMLRSLIDEKNMGLQIESDDPQIEIFQDQPKLQQILTNLLSNAIKFTPDGGLITVSMGRVSESFFYVTVADTGVGIPESDFEIIFEKFRQSNEVLQNDGLTRKFSGTGLGLSIVKELCKLLGGEIRLTSQLGTGSKFQIILPIHYAQTNSAEINAT